jgi:sugar/nucleoside kinase (ribokinase family)
VNTAANGDVILPAPSLAGEILVIGNLNVDLVFYPVNDLPAWGEEKTSHGMLTRAAGSTGYAALVLGTLEMKPVVVGNVGSDSYGALILTQLSAAGADTSRVQVSTMPTGVSVTLTNEQGARAFVTYIGHLHELTAAAMLPVIRSVPNVSQALLSGYFLLPSLGLDGALAVVRSCRDQGALTLFDSGWDPQGWMPETLRDLRRLVSEVDVFLPNQDEALAITEQPDLPSAAQALLDLGADTVIIKAGEAGSLALQRDRGLVHQPATPVHALDTTGAGDSFNAGIMFGLARGWNMERLLQFSNAVAGIVVSRRENRCPTYAEATRQAREHYRTWAER